MQAVGVDMHVLVVPTSSSTRSEGEVSRSQTLIQTCPMRLGHVANRRTVYDPVILDTDRVGLCLEHASGDPELCGERGLVFRV